MTSTLNPVNSTSTRPTTIAAGHSAHTSRVLSPSHSCHRTVLWCYALRRRTPGCVRAVASACRMLSWRCLCWTAACVAAASWAGPTRCTHTFPKILTLSMPCCSSRRLPHLACTICCSRSCSKRSKMGGGTVRHVLRGSVERTLVLTAAMAAAVAAV